MSGALAAGQWRLAEVQLANWGTFDGAIHRIDIARKGHLITGPSGSGKSSLLDAIAAVLTPDKWLRFNLAAAAGGTRGDQRSIVSYLRGAWTRTADELEDRVVSAYLRPGATWSGIVLRYENGVDRPVTLCRLFFLRGTAASTADMNDLCMVERSPLDLRDLEPFARGGLETRKVQARWSDAVVTSNGSHGKFYARLRSVFGIADEGALQLLHRTQSAKSLDSLDRLFRDFMLSEPGTFRLADTAVEQFGELRDAHGHVVQLRMQRDHLLHLRDAADRFDAAEAAVAETTELGAAVQPYQEHEKRRLATTERAIATERVAATTTAVERCQRAHAAAEQAFLDAQRHKLELGGGEAEHLQQQLSTARDAERATAERWRRFEQQLAAADIAESPHSSGDFDELMAAITATLATPPVDGASHAQHDRASKARQARQRVVDELDTLKRSGSTVPGALLDVRQRIADDVALPTSALPFVAELIEVKAEYAEWTGAIERVLRPFALTLLVRSEHLAAVRRWVDANRVPVRLVFEEVEREIKAPSPARSDRSLVHRVEVAGGSFAAWVTAHLTTRFDLACVETADELADHDRAVTIRGQIKSSRTRYEKDDRVAIENRSHWVLGDREAKHEALIEQLQAADRELETATREVERANALRDRDQQRRGHLEALRGQAWADIDRASAATAVTDLTARLDAVTREDHELRDAVEAEEAARRDRQQSGEALRAADLDHREARASLAEIAETIADLDARIASGAVPPVSDAVTAVLAERFRRVQRKIDRRVLPEIGQTVMRKLQEEKDAANAAAATAGRDIVGHATQFIDRWPAAASDLTASVDDRGGFVELLEQIVAHGLPEHEGNFQRLLRDRSQHLVADLVGEILDAPHAIEERVIPVNASLRRSKFDEGRWLRIRVKTRRTQSVQQFVGDLKAIAEHSWTDDDLDSAERRFELLAGLMRRLASSEHADRTWRQQCLDTRLHVTFLADEIDAHERVHATYDSGAAMSGGQQQKLVTFCLAAALRYQLADPDDDVPRYGTIVLDEAFDKADTRFTRMALDVFVAFGFHLVLATPHKLLQTIEPYIGAATLIENPTRQKSLVANVPWREVALDHASDDEQQAQLALAIEVETT